MNSVALFGPYLLGAIIHIWVKMDAACSATDKPPNTYREYLHGRASAVVARLFYGATILLIVISQPNILAFLEIQQVNTYLLMGLGGMAGYNVDSLLDKVQARWPWLAKVPGLNGNGGSK